MRITCPSCMTSFKVRDDKVPDGESKLRCFNCKEIFLHNKGSEGKPLILVANESREFCETVTDLLVKKNYEAESVNDGVDALMMVQEKRPAVILLDVALPRMFGFEVCESIRNTEDIKDTKILLIAAIYDQTRYKRAPVSLYGADDYIEKHHIHDLLIKKIENLLSESPVEKVLPEIVHSKDPLVSNLEGEDLSKKLDESSAGFEGEEHEKAKRLARIIVSDIALYNEHLLNEGVDIDDYHELFKEDLEEGNKYFRERVPKDIWEKRDYIMELFDELIAKQVKPN